MQRLIEISDKNIQTAYQIISELKIEEVWKKYAGEANRVGSLKTGLLLNHLDIDYHVYTKEFTVHESFRAIGEIASSPKVKSVNYLNLTEYEDRCLEWHLTYVDAEDRGWQIDIIYIMNESKYVGKFERVAEKINAVMTNERRKTILQIKYDASKKEKKVMGIEVYRAVIEDNVQSYEEFEEWYLKKGSEGIVEWEPL